MSSKSARPERTGIMLAHPASDRRVQQLGERFFIQPKLNGERCWVEWFNRETPMLISSYGNEFTLPHITAALIQQNLQGIRLDGELYIHGEPFETIHSIASASRKETHPRVEEMQYHIFDFKLPRPQYERLVFLFNKTFRPPLHFVDTQLLVGGDWRDPLLSYIESGYEGIILRGYSAEYTEKRTPFLLKYKPTEKDHYRIVDVLEGEGWCTGMLGAFIVTGDDGTPFRVGSGKLLTKPTRKALWEIKDKLPGMILEVKHEALTTTKGIPKCAVALSVVGLNLKEYSMKEDIYCAYTVDIVTCYTINCKFCEYYKAFLLKCTCTNCPENKSCLYAFDAYNTNGDCIAEK